MQIVRLTQTAPKRRKLLLVDPYPRENPYHLGPSERKAIWFPKLSLPAIAAYTPEHWDVEIQDEAVREIDLEHPADLVGISVMTCYAPRAYQLADEFRKRGVPVVLGGVHPTYCPDEALQHCDAIVTGEAEDSWPRLVADFEAGGMQRHYKMGKVPAFGDYKPPPVELLHHDVLLASSGASCRGLSAGLKPLTIRRGCRSTRLRGGDEERVRRPGGTGCVPGCGALEPSREGTPGETRRPFSRVRRCEERIKTC